MINNSPRSAPAVSFATSQHTHGALRLTELHRFTDPAEAAASLALREGEPSALDFYLDHGRVHVGDLATTTEDAFNAWVSDRAAGLDTIMLAPTRTSSPNSTAVPARIGSITRAAASEVLLGRREPGQRRRRDHHPHATTADSASPPPTGSKTATAGPSPMSANNGDLTVRHNRSHLTVRLPADYVRESTGLGYATTIHAAQGVTADTMHGLATGQESRQQLYTMLTRGRAANHLYLQVVGDGDPHTMIRPETVAPRTPTETLQQILARDETPTSATTLLRDLSDPAARLFDAVQRYTDGLHVAAEQLGWPSLKCSTAKPTKSSLNSPASRPGRHSGHTCSRWRPRPVSIHSSTCRQPPPDENSIPPATWPPYSTGASQSPQLPTRGRCRGFPAFRKRFMIIPFGARILPSAPG